MPENIKKYKNNKKRKGNFTQDFDKEDKRVAKIWREKGAKMCKKEMIINDDDSQKSYSEMRLLYG